jgi:hypothetical protein
VTEDIEPLAPSDFPWSSEELVSAVSTLFSPGSVRLLGDKRLLPSANTDKFASFSFSIRMNVCAHFSLAFHRPLDNQPRRTALEKASGDRDLALKCSTRSQVVRLRSERARPLAARHIPN